MCNYSVSSHNASARNSLRKFEEIPRPKVQMSHLERRTRKKRIIVLCWFLTSQELGTCSWRHTAGTRHLAWRRATKGVRNLKRDICGVPRLRGGNVESDDSRSYREPKKGGRNRARRMRWNCTRRITRIEGEDVDTWENGTRPFFGPVSFYTWNFSVIYQGALDFQGEISSCDFACLRTRTPRSRHERERKNDRLYLISSTANVLLLLHIGRDCKYVVQLFLN